MPHRVSLTLALAFTIAPTLTAAEEHSFLSLSAGAWNHNVNSDFSQNRNGTQVVAETDDSERSASKFFAIDAEFEPHWTPSVRLRYSELSATSVDSVTASRVIQGMPIVVNSTLQSQYEFDFYELKASWQLSRSVFYFDYGISLQYLRGDIQSNDDNSAIQEEIDTPLPALHVASGVNLRDQMSINFEVQGAEYGDNSLVESEYSLNILPNKKSGVTIGYRIFDLDYSTENSDIDVEFRGGFIAAQLGF